MADAARMGTALVFGGSRGLGAAIVQRLAHDGFTVAFTYSSNKQAAGDVVERVVSSGGTARALKADSADPVAITAAVADVVGTYGQLDAVVVNAGINRSGEIDEVSLTDLDDMLAVNVRGVFLSVQAVVPHLNDHARIMTMGSNVAVRTGEPGMSVYQMTKAAIAGLVKGVALDLAPRGITINNLQPGPFDTDMNAGRVGELAERSPLKRVGIADEVAELVSYLVGARSGYVTGASFTIDGGLTL